MISTFVVVLILTASFSAIEQASTTISNRKDFKSNDREIRSNFDQFVKFSDSDKRGDALSVLSKWASDTIQKNDGAVSFSQASSREQEVISNIESGRWSVQAYNEYQRFASVTGNVDSARLLLTYGVGYILKVTAGGHKSLVVRKLFRAALSCNEQKFRSLMQSKISEISIFQDGSYAADDGTNLLMAAAFAGCQSIVDLLLTMLNAAEDQDPMVDMTAFVEQIGSHGMNALMIAAAVGSDGVVSSLLTVGHANINATHKFTASTALHMAAEMNQASTVVVLCKHYASTKLLTTSTNSNALHVAAHCNASEETVAALINNCGLDPNDGLMNGDTTALYLAAVHGHTEAVKALLKYGANPSFAMPRSPLISSREIELASGGTVRAFGSPINSQEGNGAEAIHAAVENGHVEALRALLYGGAHINSMSMGVSPLQLAAQYSQVEVARVLLAHDPAANINLLSRTDSSTALYYAVGRGSIEMVDLLLKSNASARGKQQKNGGFPLLYATKIDDTSASVAIISMLMTAGADVNERSEHDHITAIHSAAERGNLIVFQHLLVHGANIRSLSKKKQSVLHIAITSKLADAIAKGKLVDMILQELFKNCTASGALVKSATSCPDPERRDLQQLLDAPTADGLRALHYAVIGGYGRTVRLLLEAGVEIDSPVVRSSNSDGIVEGATPLFLAVQMGNLEIASLLLSAGANVDIQLHTVKDREGISPLLSAIAKGDVAMSRLLLFQDDSASDCIVNTDSASQNTAATTTTTSAYCQTRLTADPNLGGAAAMQSPLLFAVVRGQAEIAGLLLRAGAGCNVLLQRSSRDTTTETLVEFAKRRRDFDMLQVLGRSDACNSETIRSALT